MQIILFCRRNLYNYVGEETIDKKEPPEPDETVLPTRDVRFLLPLTHFAAHGIIQIWLTESQNLQEGLLVPDAEFCALFVTGISSPSHKKSRSYVTGAALQDS